MKLTAADLIAISDFIDKLNHIAKNTGLDISRTPLYQYGEILGYIDLSSQGYIFIQD
jgi:hypothetical protein